VDRLLAALVSRSFRRALRGEPVWLAVALGAWMLRRARRRGTGTVWSGSVGTGEALAITIFDRRDRPRTIIAEE
jgi:hypothetical protein